LKAALLDTAGMRPWMFRPIGRLFHVRAPVAAIGGGVSLAET
jgi:hypothetical protein